MGMIGLLPEGNYADCANGLRMHYLDVSPDASSNDTATNNPDVVVFLHGSGPGASGHSNFKGNYPALVEAGYRCIVPDLVGYGFSDKPDDRDHPLSFFVECIKQTLDVAGVERCTLIGNSLGGAIAIALALEYPALVEKLVLMAPGGLSELPEYQQMPGMQRVFQVFGSGEPVTPAVMKDLFATGLMFNPDHATDELVAERMQIMKIMNGHVMATMQVPVLVDRLKELDCPVLGMWGMDEKMMPENGIMAMAKNIKRLRLMLVTQCGHWVMVEHENMFNRSCLDFLQESDQQNDRP